MTIQRNSCKGCHTLTHVGQSLIVIKILTCKNFTLICDFKPFQMVDTFDICAPLKSFDYCLLVGVFAVSCSYMPTFLNNFLMWDRYSYQGTILEMIKTPQLQLSLRSISKIVSYVQFCVTLYSYLHKLHLKIECGNITCHWLLPKNNVTLTIKSIPVPFDFCFDRSCRSPYNKHACDTPCITSVGLAQAHSN